MRRVLVANRGEIARRIFLTCRRLGISTVAVYSEPDAEAPFVRDADFAVPLAGSSPAETYLRGEVLIEAALRADADAVHPGYGFLAENPGFAAAVGAAGLIWIGPAPEAIAAMGSKTEARDRMEAAGVPIVPGIRLEPDTDVVAAAAAVGFPLMVKAAAGGGGKGMRVIGNPAEIEAGVAAAQRESEAAFGDPAVFLERYLAAARHVEVQVLGDSHGTVVSLYERDCSVQRRHQKVIEEAPSPAVGEQLRERLSTAAVDAGRALHYEGAGTVEFLVTGDGDFFFLEMNTRLQVEHAVTEAVTGLDLVELQLSIAEGHPLPERAIEPGMTGWAIEARIYAEDVRRGFLPVAGCLSRFAVEGDVRVDTGVEDGTEISPYYDPMIAKVIAHAPTREQAARKLADALARASVQGTITNRDFLVRVLRDEAFLAGRADTSFLEPLDPELSAPLLDADEVRRAALALVLAGQAGRRAGSDLPSGWRNNPSCPQLGRIVGEDGEVQEVEYEFDRLGRLVKPSGVVLHRATPDLVELTADGLRRTYRVTPGAVAGFEGEVALRELPRFAEVGAEETPGSLTAPMPGTVVRVSTSLGEWVEEGQLLLVLEAMKMELEVTAPVAGELAGLEVAVGDQVPAGALLAVIEPG
jgi:acetyl/propionyl-CoA carboxylase alpha subunit